MDGPATTTLANQLAAMQLLADAGGPYEDFVLGLYQNELVPSRFTTFADLTVATFTGYAPVTAVNFASAYIGSNGQVHLTGPGTLFEMTVATVLNTIYGYYIAATGGTVLLAAYALPTPVPISVAGAGVFIVPDLVWGN